MKRLFGAFAICLCVLLAIVCAGCGGGKTYTFKHESGGTSSFTLDFDALTGSYKGCPMWQVLNSGSSYKDYEITGTETCNGTLELIEDFGESGKFYKFRANSSVRWTVELSIGSNRDRIKVYINGSSYIFD